MTTTSAIPFTFRYVDATRLDREWGYSDRDQRHRFNVWTLAGLPGEVFLNNRLSYYSAQPTSASCGGDNRASARPTTNPWGPASDRICAGREHYPAQHPAQRQRVFLVGRAPHAPYSAGQGSTGGHCRGFQPAQHG